MPAYVRRYDHPHMLFYCGPLYWSNKGYGVEFGLEQYGQMAEIARTMHGRMVVSVNGILEIREASVNLVTERVESGLLGGEAGRQVRRPRELVSRRW